VPRKWSCFPILPQFARAILLLTTEVVNLAENDKENLIADLAAIVYSFTARLYGQRRAKRKTERIAAELRGEEATGDATR
jgi:predicted site-specific integrase-resolvase